MNIYIASPFFNDEQRNIVMDLEATIIKSGHDYYSSMRHGVLKTMTPEERAESAQKVFNENVSEINRADLILAMTDDFDPGTVFEIGYAFGIGKKIITFSPKNYGANVMLSRASVGHFVDIKVLHKALYHEEFDTKAQETTE